MMMNRFGKSVGDWNGLIWAAMSDAAVEWKEVPAVEFSSPNGTGNGTVGTFSLAHCLRL